MKIGTTSPIAVLQSQKIPRGRKPLMTCFDQQVRLQSGCTPDHWNVIEWKVATALVFLGQTTFTRDPFQESRFRLSLVTQSARPGMTRRALVRQKSRQEWADRYIDVPIMCHTVQSISNQDAWALSMEIKGAGRTTLRACRVATSQFGVLDR